MASAAAPEAPSDPQVEARALPRLVLTHWLVGVLLAAAVVLTYAPILVTPYAFTDDWMHLANAMRGGNASIHGFMSSIARGTVTSAYLTSWAFRIAGDLDNLRFIRAIGVLGIALLANLLYRALVRAGFSPGRSALMAFLLVITPPYQVCASWTVSFTVFYSCAATGGAVWLIQRVMAPSAPRRLPTLAGALMLMMVAVTIYPVTLMFFVVFAAIDLFRPGPRVSDWNRRVLTYIAMMGTALVLGFILFKIGVATHGKWLPPVRRGMTADIPAKLEYFFNVPLHLALHLWRLTDTPYVAPTVLLLLPPGLFFWFEGSRKRRLLDTALALALIPGIYLPNLVAEENWGAYRTQLALAPMVGLLFFLALAGYARAIRRRWAQTGLTAALVVITTVASISAINNLMRYFAEPQMSEIRIVRSRLAGLDLRKLKKLHVIPSSWAVSLNGSIFDEFGLPSTSQQWSVTGVIYVLSREKLGHRPRFQVIPEAFGAKIPKAPGEAVIDLSRLDLYK